MTYKKRTTKTLYCLLFMVLSLIAPEGPTEASGEFFLFPQLDLTHLSKLNSNATISDEQPKIGVDLFMTYEAGNFRFLSEFLLASEEQEFERFQIGWSYKKHLFWLGRFHNPIGYWNSSYHHGAHLQTSISRPAIVEFEDIGGVLPIHQFGLLVEGTFDLGQQDLGYSLALASGPEYDQLLEPWSITKPGSGLGDTSATFNFYHDSESETPGRTGLFVNFTKIPATAIGAAEIQQISTGLYATREISRWRFHGSGFYIHNRFERLNGPENSAFFNVYLQTEYQHNENWTFFARLEHTLGGKDDPYLDLFPEFVEDRALGGLRYDFANSHALKLEFSTNRVRGNDFTKLMLQWSAMF